MNLTKRKAARILRDSANLLIEKGLAKGSWSDSSGAHCAIGAISKTFMGNPVPVENCEEITQIVAAVLRTAGQKPSGRGYPTRRQLVLISDAEEMTKGQMAHLFRKTAAALEHGAAL